MSEKDFKEVPAQQKKLLPYGEIPPQPLPLVKGGRAIPARQILRVNQACRTCRKQKMRCEGPDNPPCSRCKAAGVECVFEKVGKSDMDAQVLTGPANVDRLNDLERNVDAIKQTQAVMEETLKEILAELRHRPPSSAAASTPFQEHASIDIGSPGSSSSKNSHGSRVTLASEHGTTLPPLQSIVGARSSPSMLTNGNGFRYSHHSSDTPSSPRGFAMHGTATPTSVHNGHSTPMHSPANHSGKFHPPHVQDSYIARHHPVPVHPDFNLRRRHSEGLADDTQQPPFKRQRQTVINSLLGEDEANATHPWGQLNAMDYGHAVVRGIDVIDKGTISEKDARDLWQLYFSKCHSFLPIFIPRLDTFESIRERSALCFCCVLMVAAKVRDGGNEPSALQNALWKEAVEEAKNVMFVGGDNLERVQALLLTSAWGQSSSGPGWLASGHALRYAVEIGMHRAIPRLARKIKENRADESSNDQTLIIFARVWCALYTCEYQNCLASGRPPMILDDSTLRGVREVLLHHPLAQPTDARLVAASELYPVLKSVLDSLRDLEEQPSAQREAASSIVDEACMKIDKWHGDWDSTLRSKGSVPDVLLQTIRVQRQFAYLTVHARLMVPLRSAADVENISPLLRQVSSRAIAAAREIVQICVDNPDYNDLLRYTVTHAHSSFGFAGVFLLKMTRLFHPDSAQLAYAVSLVERLAEVLSRSPAGVFVNRLRTLLASSPGLSVNHGKRSQIALSDDHKTRHEQNAASYSPSYNVCNEVN